MSMLEGGETWVLVGSLDDGMRWIPRTGTQLRVFPRALSDGLTLTLEGLPL